LFFRIQPLHRLGAGDFVQDAADGMARACVLNADHAASLPKAYLGDLITALSSERVLFVT
jgi:hypothetical protein